jgi:hypothetical protein
MLAFQPFLVTALAMGVMSLLIFMGTSILFMIPVMATRGTSQFLWFLGVGGLLTAELVVLVTLTVLVSNGTIWS